MSKTKLCV